MSSAITYDSLRSFIKEALNRTDPRVENQLDHFIMLGERVSSQVLNIEGLKTFAEGTLLAGNPVFEKDARWLSSYSLGIFYPYPNQTGFPNYRRLKYRTWTYVQESWPDNTLTGLPYQYADMEYNQIYVAPTPELAYPYLFGYYAIPPLLSPEVSTNFMTTHNPQCLMYASVMEANYFLQNYQEGDKWRERFMESLQYTTSLDQRLVADGAQRRDHTPSG